MTKSCGNVGSVVVVEDDNDVRQAVAEVLAEEGYVVFAYALGDVALAALPELAPRPRLILLDLMMPKMTGWQFCAAIGKQPHLADIPIVILSADSQVSQDVQSLQARAFMRKPIHMQTLLDLVAQYLRTP